MEIAIKIKELLEGINPEIEAFVSQVDIGGGEHVQKEIIDKIIECDKLVLCFTKENKKSPWLLFEAGYAQGLNKTVIPLLFDDDPNWHSWIDNPMNIAREIKFNSSEFTPALISSFNLKDTDFNKNTIESYKKHIANIKDKFREVDIQCEPFIEKLIHNKSFTCESPFFESKTAYFLTGFETFDLYKEIIDSFLYSGKHLWIYGRRNSKLLIGSFRDFFKYLKEKANSGYDNMGGIDFRCLFLDPESDEVNRAHLHQNIFKQELEATLRKVKTEIGDSSHLKKCFRLYQHKREEIIIRMDDCIIYSRPTFDALGRPQLLTNTRFEVFSTNSSKGVNCIQKFEEAWNIFKELS